jgi:hypothetical protein
MSLEFDLRIWQSWDKYPRGQEPTRGHILRGAKNKVQYFQHNQAKVGRFLCLLGLQGLLLAKFKAKSRQLDARESAFRTSKSSN